MFFEQLSNMLVSQSNVTCRSVGRSVGECQCRACPTWFIQTEITWSLRSSNCAAFDSVSEHGFLEKVWTVGWVSQFVKLVIVLNIPSCYQAERERPISEDQPRNWRHVFCRSPLAITPNAKKCTLKTGSAFSDQVVSYWSLEGHFWSKKAKTSVKQDRNLQSFQVLLIFKQKSQLPNPNGHSQRSMYVVDLLNRPQSPAVLEVYVPSLFSGFVIEDKWRQDLQIRTFTVFVCFSARNMRVLQNLGTSWISSGRNNKSLRIAPIKPCLFAFGTDLE